jgi:uncharacterized repeat protein (TIGR03803 family)
MTHRKCSSGLIRICLLLAVTLALALPASASWKEIVLYGFQNVPDGATPVGALVFDKARNLYGATRDGGSSSCVSVQQCGTVYRLAPPAKKSDPWTETVLYTFKGNASQDGASPEGGLVIDASGNLYGTTGYGGTGNCTVLGTLMGCGTVYELSPPKAKGGKWTETVLYSFPTPKQGFVPFGDLVFDGAGNLYGATLFGGGKGTTCNGIYKYCGAVFELSPPKTKGGKWMEKVLHGFKGGTDGAAPNGGLVLDSRGAAYGTTQIGGYNCPHNSGQGCGTVFELKPPTKKGSAWAETVLYRFNPANSGAAEPAAGVVLDRSGNLCGTTLGGGNSGSGTIFQLTPHSNGEWVEHVLHSFDDGYDGGYPMAGLVFDGAGNLYGTATVGAPVGGGTIFRLRSTGDSWALTALYEFMGKPDGSYPASSLVFDEGGKLYGTTQYSGSGQACGNYGCGTVFVVSP